MDAPVPVDPLDRITPSVKIDDRLTVRHRLDDGSATDLIGWVSALDESKITILIRADRDGEQYGTIARERIILAKRVPPAKGSRPLAKVSAEELEQAALPGWIAESEPLGEWTLRSGNGFTGRANSCLAVGDPGSAYPQAARIMIDYYSRRELPTMAQVIVGSVVERELRELGWTDSYVTTAVMVQPLTGLIDDHRRNPAVKITGELTEDWWQAYLQYRPIPDHAVARRILSGVAPVGLASVIESGRVVAIGRGQVTGEWLGIAALWTEPDRRRRGLATMIMRELGRWAARYGARAGYLQVAKENQAAIGAYANLGFTPHHDYLYLSPAD